MRNDLPVTGLVETAIRKYLYRTSVRLYRTSLYITQVNNARSFAELTRKLQEERVAVAMHYFMRKRDSLDTITDFDNFVERNLDLQFLKAFALRSTFNGTDAALAEVTYCGFNLQNTYYTRDPPFSP